jgi:5-amino-6-(5-phospho-D-ribitylamino)uracil phosphatase
MTRYRLLALDFDGTLVGRDGVVAGEVVEAIAQAEAAGVRVCAATGRSYVESAGIWRQLRLLRPPHPMILVGGAVVAEAETGRTLWQKAIPHEAACDLAEALGRMGYVAMVLVDGWRHGVDYIVTAHGDHGSASRDWFSKMNVRVQRVEHLADVAEGPEALRISTVVQPDLAAVMAAELGGRFADRLTVRAIEAPNYGVTIVEAHAAGADKMAGLRYIAQGLRLPLSQTAAVGDDTNDLTMVRGAGLGAAMPHAPKILLDAADHVVEGGLADFIRRLTAGEID